MDGWIVLAVIVGFILWMAGAFDSQEEKDKKLRKKQENCKHKYDQLVKDHIAERMNGRWESSGETQRCSKCGETRFVPSRDL